MNESKQNKCIKSNVQVCVCVQFNHAISNGGRRQSSLSPCLVMHCILLSFITIIIIIILLHYYRCQSSVSILLTYGSRKRRRRDRANFV